MKFTSVILFLSLFAISSFSLSSQNNYAYQEEFNSQGTWTKGNDDIRELYVSNGKYYFEHKKNEGNREYTTRTFSIDFTRDFEIETSILKISGTQDYGISFLYDYKDSQNYTEFGITSTGYYRVAESKSGTYSNIKSWTESSFVKKGNYATNKLKIKKSGNRITYYVNGTYVYGTDFKKFKGSKMGFRLYRDQKVAVDYFRVKYIGGSTTNTTNTTSKTILFEGFNNKNNGWLETNTSSARLAIENGDYSIDHKRQDGGWSSTIKKYINSSRNFRITAQIKKYSGIQNNGYGVTFGKKDNDNQNHFLISGDGSYKIVQYKNGTKTYIKDWAKSSYIKTGNGVYNYLKIQKVGSAYKFYINSNLVYTSYSIKMYGDRVGFTLYDRQSIKVGYLSMAYEDGKSTTNTNTSVTNNNHTIKESILFDGYTDNKNSWSTTSNENVKFEVKNGNYYIDHKRAKGGWSSTTVKYIDTSRDFKILADIKKETGILNNGYGIVFGRKDSNNQNLFYINGNGSYSINKMKNGQNNYLKEWSVSSAIRKGNDAYNVLKIVKIGSKLEYYINNTKVYTSYSPEFFGDRLGYIIYDRQKVSVAYLSVGYLDKKKTNTNNTNTNVTDNINGYTYSNSGFHFSDQFSSNTNQWSTTSDEKRAFSIKNGKYYLKHKRNEKGWATYHTKYIDTSRDFEIETKIDKISGVTNYGYGLIWGRKGTSDFRFYISSGGYYKISRMVDNKEQVIKNWITTSYVNTGNLKSNTLKVKKENDHYKFYINGNYITQIDYEAFYGNDLGFVLYNNQEIAVDYLRVKYLTNNTTVVKNKVLQLPLYDGFSTNTNGWATDNLDNYSSSVTGGKLNVHRKKEGGIFISRDVNINTSKDFVIETSISRNKAGASGMYGVTFGRKNSSNEFTFLISTNGSYMFRKFDHDKYGKIIPFTSSNAIKTGIGQSNIIKIVKSGSLLRFYVNGQYLNEATFESFFGTKFGYTAYHEQKIAVDYLNIKYQTSAEYNSPPVVVISEPDVDLKRGFKIVKTKRIQVKGKATDKDGIYEVLINGVDATVNEDGTFYANVPLKVGTNNLVVKATDIKQASSTKRFTIKRKSPDVDTKPNTTVVNKGEKLDVGFGQYYALLIGVSDYNDASNVPDLEGLPTKDAQDLKDVLVNKYNFKNENVVLLNNSPTENQILREFVKLRQKVTNKDNVLIFYAGHGVYDEKTETGSWLPSDADPEYGLNMISNSTIKDYIKGINSKHTLLISDACFSGSIFKTRSYKSAPKSITKKFELPSRKAITSGTLKTVPNRSVFLKYLIDRLNNNTELYLTARKIFDKIEEPVMNNSKNVPQYGTIQEVGDEGGDFIFIRKN